MIRATAYKHEDSIAIQCDFKQKDLVKSIGAQWDPFYKVWKLPYTKKSWQKLQYTIPGITAEACIRDELEEQVEQTKRSSVDIGPMPLAKDVHPYDHQYAAFSEAIRTFERGGTGYGLYFEMGCGKSLTAVGIAGRLYNEKKAVRVLIIAPLSVLPVWPREFADYANFPWQMFVLNDRQKAKKIKKIKEARLLSESRQPPMTILCVNYESSWRLLKELRAFAPDLIICDEGHRIKDAESKQSKNIHEIADHARYKLELTGTPVSNGPHDYFSQFRFLDKRIFGDSWYSFKSHYGILGQAVDPRTGRTYTETLGYRNMPELLKKAHSITYRVRKSECLDLPECVDETLYCYFEPEARKAYKQLQKDSIAFLDGLPAVSAQHIITQMLRLSQFCGGYAKLDTEGYEDDPDAGKLVQISNAKQKLLKETLTDLLSVEGKKVVIFARFTAEINAIEAIASELAGENGYRKIDGSVPKDVRGQCVDEFQKDPSVRIFLAQIQTAGLGITLTAADTTIYYSYSYSLADYAQSRARTNRIGQKNKCTYIHMVVENSIDEEILAALQGKQKLADICVDDYKRFLGEK